MTPETPGPRGFAEAPELRHDVRRAGPHGAGVPRAAGGRRDPTFAVILAACRARLEAQARMQETRGVPARLPAPVLEAARLARLGLSPPAIARQMGRSLGEAELLLGLARATGQLR